MLKFGINPCQERMSSQLLEQQWGILVRVDRHLALLQVFKNILDYTILLYTIEYCRAVYYSIVFYTALYYQILCCAMLLITLLSNVLY